MKHLKIVLTLTVVVVVFSAAVFGVELITTPLIDAENARVANLAKAEVLPSLQDYTEEVLSDLEDYDVTDTGIIDLFKVPGYGYVYQASFQGYQSVITYMIGINEDGEITGYKTLTQGDTPGLGAEIANPANWEQFKGMTLVDAAAGNIDGLSGATVTTTGWTGSLAKVIDFHNNVMLGFEVTDVTADLNLPDSVTKVEVVSDGTTDLEVVYTVEFTSTYSSGANVYTITIDLADGSVKKLAFVEATDSENIGKDIGNPEFAEQFKNMTQTDAIDAAYDVQAGASYPVTFGEFKVTFDAAYLNYREEFEDYVAPVETEEQKLARWKTELSVADATFTDKTADYDLADTDVTKVEFANNGTEDVAVILTFEFQGFIDKLEMMVGINLANNETTGLRVISQHETTGYGAKIVEDVFLDQFIDANMLAAKYGIFDSVAGGTLTSNALRGSFENVIGFVENQILGTGTPAMTEEQQLQAYIAEIYPGAFGIKDVSDDYTLIADIENVLEITDISNTLLGHIFIVKTDGVSPVQTDPFIKFMIGIDENKEFTGFRMIDDLETTGKADPYYLTDYADQFVGLDIEVLDYDVDAVAGSTYTHDKILAAVEDIAQFFVEEVLGEEWARPASVPAGDASLAQGMPADHYVSIYEANPYSEFIGNIYEAQDASNNVIGHVYVGVATGNGGPIYFVWGVDTTNQTELFTVLADSETWEGSTYSGGEEFRTSTWLEYYEDIQIGTVLVTPADIDAYAGVTNTTNGVVAAVEAIAQYHADNSIGGGS